MEIWKASRHSMVHWPTENLTLKMCLCLLIQAGNHLTYAGSTAIETFDGNRIPEFQCGRSGWSVQSNEDSGNYAFATCFSKCSPNITVEGGYFTYGYTVSFKYALNVQDATSAWPILNVYCEGCYPSLMWTSSPRSLMNGEWEYVEVKDIKPRRTTFNLIFEADIHAWGQVVGLDNVEIHDGKIRGTEEVPTVPLSYPANCLDSDPADNEIGDDGDDQASISTQTNGDTLPQAYYPTPDGTSIEPVDSPENTFGLLDNETTLLFAQILAILSVTVCFITVGIHCLLWRKQRRLQRVGSVVPMRRKPSAATEHHDSMLLEMNLVTTDEPDQPCSNSLNEPNKTRYLQELIKSDILQQQDPRRATVSFGSSPAHCAAVLDDSDDNSDDDQQRPHPRTKSLPNRPPVNVYESIDEVTKYQPLTFAKRPAPRPPGVPGGRRLNASSRGVQNLAAIKKYRPSSVQYEEVGNRKNGLLDEEQRDRSKSASHYDYVKRKSASQSPRRNGWKYGQAPRPKGRAPAPPTNRLYDKPVRKSRPAVKADSAPTLLLQTQELSDGEATRTDNENFPVDSLMGYDRPSTSTDDLTSRSAVESTYFTLEPPIAIYATSEDSDDERESERDISRFEDAEESGTNVIPNGATSIPLRPLSFTAPIDIPPPLSPTMADFDEDSSCL